MAVESNKIRINFKKVTPSTQIEGDDAKETMELKEMFEEASNYIKSFKWCKEIIDSYMGIGIAGIVGIFLFKIIPSNENVDEWIWIIVGDIPPAYISAFGFPNPATALDGYIGAMREWVTAIKEGKDVSKLIPVNVPPILEWAKKLETRLEFLYEEILKEYYLDDLKEYNKKK
jgi:hypothetical protein